MVRYAESPTATESIDIAATADAVWAFVSDPATPVSFSSELQSAEFGHPDAGPRVGATIIGTNQLDGRGGWTTTSTVTECEPRHRFTWVVGDLDDATATWSFVIEPTEASTTRLTFTATMGPGPSGVLDYIKAKPDREEDIVANRLDMWSGNMRATIEGIKELAEAS